MALGPQLAETHVALAELSYRLDGDGVSAEREFVRAVELDEQSVYARQRYAAFLHDQRRFDEALEQLRLAKALDPLSVMTNWQMANELFYSGQYDAAMAQANHTLELDPSHPWSFRTLGQSLEAVGRRTRPSGPTSRRARWHSVTWGAPYALTGRRAEARELLEALMRQPVDGTAHNGVAIAFILTGLGEHEKAMEWLERTQRDGVRHAVQPAHRAAVGCRAREPYGQRILRKNAQANSLSASCASDRSTTRSNGSISF